MRKSLFIFIVAMAIGIGSYAQTDKNDWLVGGNMTINTTTDNSEFSFRPSAGYFFVNNFAAGAEFLLSFSKFGDRKTNSVGVGPFARYYFTKNPNFKPMVHASFNVASESSKENNIKTTNTVTSLFLGGGGAFFINRNVAIEALAGYNRSKFENFDPEGGFLFRIGFQVHLLGHEVINRN